MLFTKFVQSPLKAKKQQRTFPALHVPNDHTHGIAQPTLVTDLNLIGTLY